MLITLLLLLNKNTNQKNPTKTIALHHILRRSPKAFRKAGPNAYGGNTRAVLNSLPKAGIIHSPVTCPLSPKHERREIGDNGMNSQRSISCNYGLRRQKGSCR